MTGSSEQFIESTGGFGRYQLRIFLIFSYAVYFCAATFMVMTFSTAEPPWRCATNATSCTSKGTFKPGQDGYDHRCKIPRSDWEFAIDGDFDSIITEWDLVCDKAVYPTITNSLTFVTMLIGASLGSILGDKFGRKTLTIPGVVSMCLAGFISAFSQTYWVFALFRTVLGLGLGTYSACGYIWLMEFIGPSYRSRVGVGIYYSWTLSLFTIALLGYLIQSWRTISIIVSVPGLLFWIFWWFTPESLRWLMTKQHVERSEAIYRKISEVNKSNVTEEDIESLLKTSIDEASQIERFGDIRDLFSTRTLTVRTLVSWYGWITAAMVYYGIFLGAPSLGGNMYLNFFITAACEGIGMIIAIFALDKFGRKKTLTVSVWIAAVAMLVSASLTHYDDGSTGYLAGKILSTQVIGMFAITIVFDGLYVYSSELFPTVVRNTGLGTSSGAGRIGSACSPYIVFSVRVHPLMPSIIMAVIAIICGLLFFMLPETYKKAMPDTLQQVDSNKNIGENGLVVGDDKDDNFDKL